MLTSISVLDNRTLSSFGVSIGTGLALESLFTPTAPRYDVTREIPIKVKPTDYKVHAYNVYTLLRNIVAATEEKDKSNIYRDKKLSEVLIEEVNLIKALYEGLDIEVVFYTEDYEKIYKKLNYAKDVKPTRAYDEYVLLSKVYKGKDRLPITIKKALVFTSFASDIMDKSSNYSLLESHTGRVKDKSTLYSKYHPIGKRDMSVFPVNGLLLYLLGDKYISRPYKISLRVELYNIAVEKHWNYRTTIDKIKRDTYHVNALVAAINDYKGKL